MMSIFSRNHPHNEAAPDVKPEIIPLSAVAQLSLEQEVRAKIWDNLNDATASAGGMTFQELRDFLSRQYFPSPEQIQKLAAYLDAPVSGLDVLRSACLSQQRAYGGAGWIEKPLNEKSVLAFIDGDNAALTPADLNVLANLFFTDAEFDVTTNKLRRTKANEAISQGSGPPQETAKNIQAGLERREPSGKVFLPPVFPREAGKVSKPATAARPGWQT
jgi:hypothetical protein